jgi:hypothetical protein
MIMGLAAWGMNSLLPPWLQRRALSSDFNRGHQHLERSFMRHFPKSKLAHRLFGTRIDRLKAKLGL